MRMIADEYEWARTERAHFCLPRLRFKIISILHANTYLRAVQFGKLCCFPSNRVRSLLVRGEPPVVSPEYPAPRCKLCVLCALGLALHVPAVVLHAA